jgi:hypothetical protein
MKMTARQRLMHGFMQYIHNFAMRELQYEYVRELEKKKLAQAKKKKKRKTPQ